VIYYNKWGQASTPTVGNETDSGFTEGTSPVQLTSNFDNAGRVFAMWTSGSSAPYNINWEYVIVPEFLWMMLPLGLIFPKLLKKKRRLKPNATLKQLGQLIDKSTLGEFFGLMRVITKL
jgi:hypothetical protein